MSAGEWQPVNDTTGRTTINFIPAGGVNWWTYEQWRPQSIANPTGTISVTLKALTYDELLVRIAALEWELAQLKQQLQDDKDQP